MNAPTGGFSNDKNYMFIIHPGDIVIAGEELTEIPKLEKLKAGLNGGYMELVPFLNKFMGRYCVAFCDEDGKRKGLRPNELAQEIWEEAIGRPILNDHLVGPIVIIVGSLSFLSLL
jgi:hypothetical protein